MTNNERYPFNNIHETVIITEGVIIGTGNIIGPYCLIGLPAEWKGKEYKDGNVIIGNNNRLTGLVTVDSGVDLPTMIGDNNYLMKSVHIGHDVSVCDNVTISCGAKIGGHTVLLHGVTVGLNAVIHQKQTIAKGCMIGMGAVITKGLKTEPFKKYVGNPAKLLGENTNHPEYTINMDETL